MGVGKQANVVHLIDFGLSKEYRNPNTHRHTPYNKAHGLIGSPTFVSIHSHLGMELGRRDDLESLAYILIYFLRGSLPWQGLCSVQDIVQRKQRSTRTLCHRLPAEFRDFLDYCHSLDFDAKPNYDRFHKLFGDLLSQEGCDNDMGFDWDATDDPVSGG
jgi:serine/threonine protein kinase